MDRPHRVEHEYREHEDSHQHRIVIAGSAGDWHHHTIPATWPNGTTLDSAKYIAFTDFHGSDCVIKVERVWVPTTKG